MEQTGKFSFKKILTVTLLSVLSALCFALGAFNIAKANASGGTFNLVAHYEFNDASNLGKDSSSNGYNLKNSGAIYDDQIGAVDFGTNGFLYAPALNEQNQDFSDLITGSYSLSFRLYVTNQNAGGGNWIVSTNGYGYGASLNWAYSGIGGAFSGVNPDNSSDNNNNYSGAIFDNSASWYRIHVMYNDSAKTWTIKYSKNDGSLVAIQKKLSDSITFGGDANYTFTLGAQADYKGGSMTGHITSDEGDYKAPLMSDFRVYTGIIDTTEMENIANADKATKAEEKIVMDQQVFGDHMILQRNKKVEIYGKATPNETVTVTFNGQTKTGTVNSSGEFSVYLDAMTANASGQTLTISCDGAEKKYTDVLVGEVFLGIGQSNMAYSIFEFTYAEQNIKANNWSTLEDITTQYENTKYNANATIKEQLLPYKNNAQYLRFYMQDTAPGDSRITWNTWLCPTTSDFEDIDNLNTLSMVSYTAVAYATQLQAKLGCPVGVVVNARGGSRARQWLSPEGAQVAMPGNTDSAIGQFYDTMTKPMGRFTYAGILWYQGESDIYDLSEGANWVNTSLAIFNDYRSQQNDMKLPVIVYQLPQFYGHDPSCYWQQMRECQAQLTKNDENVYLVCGIDTGDYCNIHPTDKVQLNERAVAIALEYIYGKTYSEVYGGSNGTWGKAPEIVSAVRKDGYVTLTFKNAVYLSIKQNPDNNYKNNDGNNLPFYLTKTPITFDNASRLSSSETISETFGDYWIVGDNQIGFACSDTSIKYVSYAINNTYADNDRFIYNTYYKVGDGEDALYGVPVMPFRNVEIIDDTGTFSSTLTVNDSSMGSVSGYQTGTYESGTSLTITITAKDGYKISSVKWNGTAEAITNETTLTLSKTANSTTTLEVTFAVKQYTVTINVTGGTADKNTVTVDHNGTATFKVTPNSNYEFSTISSNATFSNGTVTVASVTANTTVTVTYKLKTFTASVTSANGSVTGIENGSSYEYGKDLSITIRANDNYKIKSITLNGAPVSVTNESETSFTHQVTGTITLQVTYESTKVQVTVGTIDSEEGSVSGIENGSYEIGKTFNVTITAQKGYVIKKVTWKNTDLTIDNNKTFTTTLTVQAKSTLIVTFEKEHFSATVNNDSAYGTVQGISNGSNYEYGADLYITIMANDNYKIKSITLNGAPVSVTNEKEMTIDHKVNGAITLDVKYEADIKTVTVTVKNDSTKGTITGVTSTTYNSGKKITVTITAKEGYEIKSVKFGSKSISISNPASTSFVETLTDDVTITVTYEKATSEETSGSCGSSIGGVSTIILSLLALVSASVLIYKKKEN